MKVNKLRMNRFQALALLATSAALAVGFAAWAQAPAVRDTFEIGDELDPMVAGSGDVLGDQLQNGPDWDDLFAADRSFRDQFDEFGNAGSNGVPDFLDTFGTLKLRRDGLFVIDAISAGSGVDPTRLDAQGRVVSGTVASPHDLGNVYAYTLFTPARDLVVYGAMERLASGAGSARFELNQSVFSVAGDGTITGDRTLGDLRVQANFSADVLTSLDVYKWELVDAQAGLHDWVLVQSLPYSPENSAEQCVADGAICAVCNGAGVDGGDWPNYDAQGATIQTLATGSLLEFGVNVSALLGVHTYGNYYETRFTSMQVSTYDGAATPAPQDYTLGALERASKLAN
jgi:hypothetical protein